MGSLSISGRARLAIIAAAVGVLAASSSANAGTVTLTDSYTGGLNTYNNPGDVIGPSDVFDILSAVATRTGPNGNTLQITINTNFAGVAGTAPADGTGYGALFLTPGANSWHPTGDASNGYATDTYTAGEWDYAFTMPTNPGSGSQNGLGDLYAIGSGSVVASNVNGNPVTAPFANNPGFYFRQGQAVQFNPDQGAPSLAGGTWTVTSNGPGNVGQVTFDIVDNHLLGDDFSLSWAMTCGNDVIQGLVSGVPEPSTWVMIILGFGMLGTALRRRRVPAASPAA